MARSLLGLLVLGGVCVSGTAVAQVEVYLEPVSAPGQAPRIEATLIGAPLVPASAISLSTTVGGELWTTHATRVRSYDQGSERLAIAFVINGSELWMGNDDIEADDGARYLGVLKPFERAFDRIGLPALLPAGSEGMVVTYATGAQVRVPRGPIARLTGSAFGTQKEYYGQIGDDLVSGITLGMAELARSPAQRKALVIIGDGNDTNDEAARPMLAQLKKDAARMHIQTFAITYKSAVSAEGNTIAAMVPGASTVNSVDGMAAAIGAIAYRLVDRYYVTFDGADLPWDGRDHDLTVRIDLQDTDPVTVTMPRLHHATPWWRRRWLAELGLGALLVGLIALLFRWRIGAAGRATAE
jgi:hypothetical protein